MGVIDINKEVHSLKSDFSKGPHYKENWLHTGHIPQLELRHLAGLITAQFGE